ncbi:hypothetical protein F5141DRAFT_633735 [Pisolithus sp. B1]|nr:hypothetical protein F5141DRAFT_633735 [Pisolithus sp. B1]
MLGKYCLSRAGPILLCILTGNLKPPDRQLVHYIYPVVYYGFSVIGSSCKCSSLVAHDSRTGCTAPRVECIATRTRSVNQGCLSLSPVSHSVKGPSSNRLCQAEPCSNIRKLLRTTSSRVLCWLLTRLYMLQLPVTKKPQQGQRLLCHRWGVLGQTTQDRRCKALLLIEYLFITSE